MPFVYMCVSLVCVSQTTTRGDTIELSLLHTFLSGTRTNYRWIWIREIAVLADTCIENGGRGERTRSCDWIWGKLCTHTRTYTVSQSLLLPSLISSSFFGKGYSLLFVMYISIKSSELTLARCIPTRKAHCYNRGDIRGVCLYKAPRL